MWRPFTASTMGPAKAAPAGDEDSVHFAPDRTKLSDAAGRKRTAAPSITIVRIAARYGGLMVSVKPSMLLVVTRISVADRTASIVASVPGTSASMRAHQAELYRSDRAEKCTRAGSRSRLKLANHSKMDALR